GNIVAVLDPGDARVVAVDELVDLRSARRGRPPLDALRLDGPRQPIRALPGVELHRPARVVHAEDAREALTIRHDGAVEDAVRRGDEIVRDDRVAAVAPDDGAAAGGAVLPGEVGKGRPGHTDRGRCLGHGSTSRMADSNACIVNKFVAAVKRFTKKIREDVSCMNNSAANELRGSFL